MKKSVRNHLKINKLQKRKKTTIKIRKKHLQTHKKFKIKAAQNRQIGNHVQKAAIAVMMTFSMMNMIMKIQTKNLFMIPKVLH